MTITRASAAFSALAAAALLLAGCSGGASSDAAPTTAESTAPSPVSSSPAPAASAAADGDQSKQDACQIIITSFNDVTEASGEINTSDPQAAVDRFKELATKVQGDFSQITNADIAPAAQNASATLNQYVTFLEGVIADPSTASGLSEQVTALQESFTQAGTACAG